MTAGLMVGWPPIPCYTFTPMRTLHALVCRFVGRHRDRGTAIAKEWMPLIKHYPIFERRPMNIPQEITRTKKILTASPDLTRRTHKVPL